MFTNTYLPHVGGVARSVENFSCTLRQQGHQVLIIAPHFPNSKEEETGVIRVPAMERFNGSDFSVYLPIPGFLDKPLEDFKPDIIHSHHPFLLGDTALRMAAVLDVPLVFTHHTLYEQYTHYVAADSEKLKAFIINLASGYANQCHQVIAPSLGVSSMLRDRSVTVPITILPTGIETDCFAAADGKKFRSSQRIPADAFVAGHTGRLAAEKNLPFLIEVIASFLKASSRRHFIIVGVGPLEEEIKLTLNESGIASQVHWAGVLHGEELANAYAAMDIFVFASHSETQGMVLAESMAAGTPVIAIKSSGVEDMVINQKNGFLLPDDDSKQFLQALETFENFDLKHRQKFKNAALSTAQEFSLPFCTQKLIDLYQIVLQNKILTSSHSESSWVPTIQRLQAEWKIWSNFFHATTSALLESSENHQ